ncbi:MAG: deoxyribose-phosphate aldolase [candidate division Zixibacteria bacterium HGW-Zixibacteria-1]|nr:MAG: deoxyribose-phosphate aldolase [candidate division Zixibacteria bacterium HGW-Zixibacteria-1]
MIENLNRYFDHSILTPETDQKAIEKLCREAKKYAFYGIAINPYWVKYAKKQLSGSDIKIVSVSGFPLSANTTDIKVAEAVKGVDDGADEIDMVANVGLMVSGKFNKVEDEIYQIKKALPGHIILKVIIEAPKLSAVAQVEAVKAIINAGADFVKTATGFFGGATVKMVERLKRTANGQIKVKASGGIRTLADAMELIRAGADRIGSSASVAIMEESFAAKAASK